jgi:hypothetical protein
MAGLLDLYAGRTLDQFEKPKGLLNVAADTGRSLLDPTSDISRKAAAWNKKLQKGIQDHLEGKADTPEAEFAMAEAMNMAGMAPAMTAWHGSPHKFDKFSLDKIGTGEGNQSYGHGLYLAENQAVANEYQRTVNNLRLAYDGEKIADRVRNEAAKILMESKGDKAAAIKEAERYAYDNLLIPHIKEMDAGKISAGNLYKLDIPDEAAAKFLDYDNPVSDAIRKPLSDAAMAQWESGLTGTSGGHLYDEVMFNFKMAGSKNPREDASKWLAKNGTSGMRYLDNGSRSGGTGTSNFVVFDPEMIRILERNGQATGLQPWGANEWSGLLK